MTHRPSPVLIIGIVLLLVLLFSSVFTVHQTQQAVVFQFGKPVAAHQEPGLKFKLPFIQDVEYFDKRLLEFNASPKELTAADQKRLIVDAFVRYRIIDPLRFRQAAGDERRMNDRLNSILESSLRQVIGSVPLSTVVSTQRAQLMLKIRDIVNRQAAGRGDEGKEGFGIDVVDVRITRADLPQQNSEAIYNRMRTARIKEAKDIRARGAEEAQKIRAMAEKDRTILIATAEQQAETIRGQGDAETTKISAAAYGRDPEFFQFYRSMEAYRKTLGSKDTRMILSPDTQFMKDFNAKP